MNIKNTEEFIYTWNSILSILPISISRTTLFRRYTKAMLRSGTVVKILKGRGKRPTVRTTKAKIDEFVATLITGTIYFIQAEDCAIKIGRTIDIKARLRKLQADCPLEVRLIGTIQGDPGNEKKIHQKFQRYRIHGKWFRINKSILNYIAKYKKEEIHYDPSSF